MKRGQSPVVPYFRGGEGDGTFNGFVLSSLDVKITSSKFQSRKLTMILHFYLQLGKGNFFSGRFGHSKNCSQNYLLCYKVNILPPDKLILLTAVRKRCEENEGVRKMVSTK